jgi:hypothetical protein
LTILGTACCIRSAAEGAVAGGGGGGRLAGAYDGVAGRLGTEPDFKRQGRGGSGFSRDVIALSGMPPIARQALAVRI